MAVNISIDNSWACSRVFDENGQPKSAFDRLEDRAENYGCCSRTLQGYVASGNVLGIEIFENRYIYHCGPDEIKGPIPAADKKIALKPGTKGISYAICDGSPVSSDIVMVSIDKTTKEGKLRKQPTATLHSGISGAIVCITCRC